MIFNLEHEVLVNRYLYYVQGTPILSDQAYDDIEREARSIYPENNVVHKIGSSNPDDYSDKIKRDAQSRVEAFNDYMENLE